MFRATWNRSMRGTGFGVMAVDGRDRIIDFVEKPKDPPGIPGNPDMALASMGIYVFNAAFLYEQLIYDADDNTSDANRKLQLGRARIVET